MADMPIAQRIKRATQMRLSYEAKGMTKQAEALARYILAAHDALEAERALKEAWRGYLRSFGDPALGDRT